MMMILDKINKLIIETVEKKLVLKLDRKNEMRH